MDSSRFDTIARSLAAPGNRRRFIGGALAAAGTLIVGPVGRRGADAACPPGAVQGPRNRCICKSTGRPAVNGRCAGYCSTLYLSGGPDATTEFGFDDDVKITLNGRVILDDQNGQAVGMSPISFAAKNGDVLRFVATDVQPPHYGFSPLYLFCADTGAVQALDADGLSVGDNSSAAGVYYDESFTINL